MTSPHTKGAVASSTRTMGIGARAGAMMADFKGTFIVAIVQSRWGDALQRYRKVPEGDRERERVRREGKDAGKEEGCA
jgi:hypothetical protein